MAHVDAIVAARAFDGAVARGEDNRLTLIGEDHLRLGLGAGLLFDKDELAAVPVAAVLPEQKNHLQGKADVAVEILVETVVAAGLVVEHERGGLRLPGFVARFQESGMFAGILRSVFAERFGPVICDFGEVRIGAASELGDQFRQRVGEIFVVANSEAIALHDDVAAKLARIIVERHE